jgi:hypothetical protein
VLRNVVRRIIRSACGLLVVTALVAFAGPAGANGTQKVDLLKQAFGTCSTGAAGGVPEIGFAVIHATGSGKLIAEVAMKNATPNHTYPVSLVQTPSGENCLSAEGTITTNGKGNGNVNIQEPLLPGTTGAFILMSPTDGNGFIATTDVPVT